MTNTFHQVLSPRPAFSVSNYFWRKWRPLLGNSLAILVMEARARCLASVSPGASMGSFQSSLGDFARAVGLSGKQVVRLMKRPFAEKFVRYELTYIYDGELEKTIRGKCVFHVALIDPIIPDEKMETSIPDFDPELIHNDAPLREQPKPQNVEKEPFFSGQPNGQNVVNICNIINNNITTATTANCTPSSNFEKGEQIEVGGKEAVVAAVRNKFRNAISAKKVLALIQNTGLENVRNQLLWFPSRDNSWARKGPVVAFIAYCEQERGEPEKKVEVASSVLIAEDRSSVFVEQQVGIVERRKRYSEPERFDCLKTEIGERIISDSPVASGIFKSCFIGEVRVEGTERAVVVDTPNPFCREWLKRGYEEKILKFLKQKSEGFTRLYFVCLN